MFSSPLDDSAISASHTNQSLSRPKNAEARIAVPVPRPAQAPLRPKADPASPANPYADREVLKVEDVVEILRMEERLVYAAIKRNEIPGVRRFGKRGIIRVSRRVFFDWLHGRTS